jgi:hypothetical protein
MKSVLNPFLRTFAIALLMSSCQNTEKPPPIIPLKSHFEKDEKSDKYIDNIANCADIYYSDSTQAVKDFYIKVPKIVMEGTYFDKMQCDYDFVNTPKRSYYLLVDSGNLTPNFYCYNPKYAFIADSIKIKMIKELLSFDHDYDKCARKVEAAVHNINPLSSTIPITPAFKPLIYPIRVEALSIINKLYFEEQFEYSDIPALINKKNGSESLVNDVATVDMAYDMYKSWFKKVELLGISNARKFGLKPLNGDISWYQVRYW